MDGALILDTARMALGGVIAAIGLVMVVGGAIGVLRFPDFYTRLHAANVGDGVGVVIALGGAAVAAPDGALALRLLLLAALVMVAQPVLTHLLGSAAHAGGLAPIAGRYTAPRPGAPRKDGAS